MNRTQVKGEDIYLTTTMLSSHIEVSKATEVKNVDFTLKKSLLYLKAEELHLVHPTKFRVRQQLNMNSISQQAELAPKETF